MSANIDVRASTGPPRGTVFGAAAAAIVCVTTTLQALRWAAKVAAGSGAAGAGADFVLFLALVLTSALILTATGAAVVDDGRRLIAASLVLIVVGWLSVFSIGPLLLVAAGLTAFAAVRASTAVTGERRTAWALLALVGALAVYVAIDMVRPAP